jgi:hypothetical protein
VDKTLLFQIEEREKDPQINADFHRLPLLGKALFLADILMSMLPASRALYAQNVICVNPLNLWIIESRLSRICCR